jgi:hypothetical protein
VRFAVAGIALFMLAILAASLGGTTSGATTSKRDVVAAAVPSDRLAVVRGGIASPLVPGERLAVAGDLVATIALRAVPETRYARTLRVTLADGVGPANGGSISVSAHMRFMDHGSFVSRAVAEGDGVYVASLPFAMAGEWEIVIAFEAGADRGEIVLDIDEYD